jgi:hypothetical protein
MSKSKNKKNMSQKQLDANRNNAKKSTGPGDTSVTRYNRTDHGFRGSRIVLPTENPEDYKAMSEMLIEDLQPIGFYEDYLVKRIGDRMWELERTNARKRAILKASEYRDEEAREMAKMEQYAHAMENGILRMRKELSQVQALRRKNRPEAASEKPLRLPFQPPDCQVVLPTQGEEACEDLLKLAKARILEGFSSPDPLGRYFFMRADRELANDDPHPNRRKADKDRDDDTPDPRRS